MDPLAEKIKALKPDEPDEEIAKDLASARQQGMSDDTILQKAAAYVQGGGGAPAAPAPSPDGPGAPAGPPAAAVPPQGPAGAPPAPPSGGGPAAPPPNAPDPVTGRDAAVAALQGLAGLGDAISGGYGGQKTDFLKTSLALPREDAASRLARSQIQQGLQKGQQELKAGETSEAAAEKSAADLKALQDPTSTMSRQRQAANKPILLAAGYKPEDIDKIPGQVIDDTLKGAVSFADAKARLAELRMTKDLTLAVEKGKLGVEERKNAATIAEQEKERKAKHPILSALGMLDDEPPAGGAPAAGAFAPDVVNYAQAHGITPEQAQAIKDKRTAGQ